MDNLAKRTGVALINFGGKVTEAAKIFNVANWLTESDDAEIGPEAHDALRLTPGGSSPSQPNCPTLSYRNAAFGSPVCQAKLRFGFLLIQPRYHQRSDKGRPSQRIKPLCFFVWNPRHR